MPDVAADFTLRTLQDAEVQLSDLRGRWVIVNFWATWCSPCVDELPFLQQIAETYASDVVVLGVNMREQPAAIAPFIQAAGVSFPILLEPDDAMLLWYGPQGLPLTYVIAPDGTVALRQYGALNPGEFATWLEQQQGR